MGTAAPSPLQTPLSETSNRARGRLGEPAECALPPRGAWASSCQSVQKPRPSCCRSLCSSSGQSSSCETRTNSFPGSGDLLSAILHHHLEVEGERGANSPASALPNMLRLMRRERRGAACTAPLCPELLQREHLCLMFQQNHVRTSKRLRHPPPHEAEGALSEPARSSQGNWLSPV